MPKESIGKTITLEPNRVYITLFENPDAQIGVQFEVQDTYDENNLDNHAVFMAALTRGMLDVAVKEPEMIIKTGISLLEEEGLIVRVGDGTEEVRTKDGEIVSFPKPQGNA